MLRKFEDVTGLIRSSKSKKNCQCNGQTKEEKQCSTKQNILEKTTTMISIFTINEWLGDDPNNHELAKYNVCNPTNIFFKTHII